MPAIPDIVQPARILSGTARPIRLLTLLEAKRVTGVAKTFIQFCRFAGPASPADSRLRVFPHVVSFSRITEDRRRDDREARLERLLRAVGAQREVIAERFPFDVRPVARLRDVASTFGPDIIESHSVKSHAVVFSSGLWRQLPWIAYHHGYTVPDWKMRAYNTADWWTLRMADRVVTVAEAFASILIRRGVRPERLTILHNSVETAGAAAQWVPQRRAEIREALSLRPRTSLILSMGRLSEEKGVADLLQSFASLVTRNRLDLFLVIAGDGPERKRLENLSGRLGVAARTHFAGHVMDPYPYYAAADVLVIASHSEGSSHTLLEALAAGVPVVATAAGGTPEIITNDVDGLLTPPDDPPAMTDAIERVLTDRRLAAHLISAGKSTVAERFNPAVRADRLIQVFCDVLNERKQTRERAR